MTTRALLAALLIAAPLMSQEATPAPAPEKAGKPWLVSVASWGKFATLGVAAGFLALAAGAHAGAEDDYSTLLNRCQVEPDLCIVGGSGGYVDVTSEALYQQTLDGDAAARHWLLVSQVALAASALLWIVDLTQGGRDPENVPYVPDGPLHLDVSPGVARIGLRFRF